MVTNKFFDTTPPPGDPGSTDPSDRPFLNFTRRQQTQNSTLPIIPDALDTPMANQFGDVYTPALPMSPETAPPPAPTFEPDVTAQQQASTFKEITDYKQIFNQIDSIVQAEKPNLPQEKYTKLNDIVNKYRANKGYANIDPYEAGTLAMDEIYIELDRPRPRRVRDEKANVSWRDTWSNLLQDNISKQERFGSFGGELAFNDFKKEEGLRNAPKAIFETLAVTTGLGGIRQIGARTFFRSRLGNTKSFKETLSPKNWANYNTLGTVLRYEAAEERFLIPYATGLYQGQRIGVGWTEAEELAFEQAVLAHRAEFGDGLFSKLLQPFLVNTANYHSTQKRFLEEQIEGMKILGVDVEPGEMLGFFTGIGVLPSVASGITKLGYRTLKAGGRKLESTLLPDLAGKAITFRENARITAFNETLQNQIIFEAGQRYLNNIVKTLGPKAVADIPNQLSNAHKADDRIIFTPLEVKQNLLDPQMPLNKPVLDQINRIYDDIPDNMSGLDLLEFMSNPHRRMTTNYANTIYWNTHQNAKNELIDNAGKITKPFYNYATEPTYRQAIGETEEVRATEEALKIFNANKAQRKTAAQILNFFGLQTSADKGIKGVDGNQIEFNLIRNEFESTADDINNREFFSYEEADADYQLTTIPIVSDTFNALDSMRIALTSNIPEVDDVLKPFFSTNIGEIPNKQIYKQWFDEFNKIISKKNLDINRKNTFENAIRLVGLDEIITKPNSRSDFQTIYDHVRMNMVKYDVRISDSAFLNDDGFVQIKNRFAKPVLDGKGNKVWRSKDYWITEVKENVGGKIESRFEVTDTSDPSKAELKTSEMSIEDAMQFVDEASTVNIPNILTGEFSWKDIAIIPGQEVTVNRLRRSTFYNQYNILGNRAIRNDEKILNLVHNYEDYGLYDTVERLIAKYPDIKVNDLLTEEVDVIYKGMDSADYAKLSSEIAKYKALSHRQLSYEKHFAGADANGLGWARLKTVTQPDGTRAISVTEIQSWKSSRFNVEKDRVPLSKIKEWQEFEGMIDQYKILKEKQARLRVDNADDAKRSIADNDVKEYTKKLHDFADKNDFLTEYLPSKDAAERRMLEGMDNPWNGKTLKVAPGTPKFNEKQFNQLMARMILEYAYNTGHARILFDDSITSVGPSITQNVLSPDLLHRVDINAMLWSKNQLGEYEILPIGLNKTNDFTTISESDWNILSSKFIANDIDPLFDKIYDRERFKAKDFERFWIYGGAKKAVGKKETTYFVEPYLNDLVSNRMTYDTKDKLRLNVPGLNIEDIGRIYGKDVQDAILTDEVVRKGNRGALHFGKYPENTKLDPGGNLRNILEGPQTGAYSKIRYKVNFASEATNSNAVVEEVKFSVPYYMKQLFKQMPEYKDVNIELVATKYDTTEKVPNLVRVINEAEYETWLNEQGELTRPEGDQFIPRKQLGDREILDLFKESTFDPFNPLDSVFKSQDDFIQTVIKLMEENLALKESEFPEIRNVDIPSQLIYKKAFAIAKDKYNVSDKDAHELLDALKRRNISEDDQYRADVMQYEAQQYYDPDDPFTSEPDPVTAGDFDVEGYDRAFAIAYDDAKHIDAITLELDGKPLTMQDIKNVTDFEVFRKTKSGVKASTKFINESKIIINAYKNADARDMFHEIGHVVIPRLREFLDEAEYNNVKKYYGVVDEKWTRKIHEKFADDFMDYLSDPNSKFWTNPKNSYLRRGFEYLISFFKRMFGSTITERTGLSPEIKKLIYAVHKKVPDEGFSKFDKELDFPIDPQSRAVIDRIEASNARKVSKIERIEEIIKRRSSPDSDGKGRKPRTPYEEMYEDGDEPYKILYQHFLPNHEETVNVGIMRQLEGAHNAIQSQNEQWVRETQKAIYDKYKINQDSLTTDLDLYGTETDTLDLYAALHGEILVSDPALITKDMKIINISGQQFGIKTPVSIKEARDTLTHEWKRDLFNRITVMRLEEENEMLDFLSDTFRAIDVAGWDPVRLGFNAEIFFEKMMGIPNYFPRMWQDKGGKFFGPGKAGSMPRFAKERSDRTFIELVAPNASYDYEGLLPSVADPSIMMATRKMYGAKYRELQIMMNTLEERGLRKTLADLEDMGLSQTEINDNWMIPQIGPQFEGMLVPGKGGEFVYTPKYYVPKNTAKFLENIYGVEVTGRGFRLFDMFNMFGKQIKVAFAPLQHIDMYSRAIASSTAGLVFETVTGGFVRDPVRYGRQVLKTVTAPVSIASDIFLSNIHMVGKRWRNRLATQLASDNFVSPNLKGEAGKVTYKMLEEQGAGVKGDRGIINGVTDSIKGFKEANPNFGKRMLKQINAVNNFFQGGLFEGTYRYTQMHAIKNYALPYSQRVNKGFTAQQHAAWAASYSNKQFSTLGLYQEWFKGAKAQKIVNGLFFSRIENQALIEQGIEALGFKAGTNKAWDPKRAAFFANNFVGFWLSFYIIGNLININAQINKFGMPKDQKDFEDNYLMKDDQMVPLQKSPTDEGFPLTYNSNFMSPIVGYFGRNGQAVYLDQVGQMDTIFRYFNPIDALQGRLGVLPATIMRQYTGTTFFGQPFENKWMRATQAISDLSLPWMANNALNVTATKYPQTQKYIPQSEKRLGVAGQTGQFFVNLRAINNTKLKQFAVDSYKRDYVMTGDTFMTTFKTDWNLLSNKQKEEVLNKYPQIRDELNRRKFENNSLERIQALPEIEKGVAISEFNAIRENERIRLQIGIINEFVNDLGRFGSQAFEMAQIERGSDIEYRKLQLLNDALADVDQDYYAGKDAIKLYNAMDEYEPETSDENTKAMSNYYDQQKRFTSEESGIFMIEDWIEFRDKEFMPSLTESQRTFIEDNLKPSDVVGLQEYYDWRNMAYESGYSREYFETKLYLQERLKDMLEQRDAIPDDKYID